jgi:hypothetical protein
VVADNFDLANIAIADRGYGIVTHSEYWAILSRYEDERDLIRMLNWISEQ